MNDVFRTERKFLISTKQMYSMKNKLSSLMQEDKHNCNDGYVIRSLYFDSLEDRDFEEKEAGVLLRRKFRLRCYGAQSTFANLEMKQKEGALQRKRSLKLTKLQSQSLIKGEYNSLLECQDSFAAECYALMNMYLYKPKSIVEYRRLAFIAKENKIRITFDHHITGTESNFDIFSSSLCQYPILDQDLVVLEVKYNGFLPAYIKDMLINCNRSELSVGKYSLSRLISKHYCF